MPCCFAVTGAPFHSAPAAEAAGLIFDLGIIAFLHPSLGETEAQVQTHVSPEKLEMITSLEPDFTIEQWRRPAKPAPHVLHLGCALRILVTKHDSCRLCEKCLGVSCVVAVADLSSGLSVLGTLLSQLVSLA